MMPLMGLSDGERLSTYVYSF